MACAWPAPSCPSKRANNARAIGIQATFGDAFGDAIAIPSIRHRRPCACLGCTE
jgi:hypothetical protein